MKNIVLAGNAITAEILYSYLKHDKRYKLIGLTVDDEYLQENEKINLPLIGSSKIHNKYSPDECSIIMAMGYHDLNRSRESMFCRLKDMGYMIETYIHPEAVVHSETPPGEGSVILPSAVIEPYVKVGENSMIWSNATLAHHSEVEDHCWIATGTVLSGQARVSRNSFIGVNATVVNEVVIGEHNIIGAAAMVSKNTKPNTVHLSRSAEPFRGSSDDYVKFFGV